jgi:hypothetical protein
MTHENPSPQFLRTEVESAALPEVRRQAESTAQTLPPLCPSAEKPAEEVGQPARRSPVSATYQMPFVSGSTRWR